MRDFFHIVLVSICKIISLGVLFLAGILVANNAGPVGLGYYNLGLTFLLLIDAFVGQPLDNAMIRYNSLHGDESDGVESVQGGIFRLKMLFGVLLLLVVIFFSDSLTTLLMDSEAPKNILRVVGVSVLALLAVRSTSCMLQIQHEFKRYASLDAVQGVLRLAGILVLFYMGVKAPEAYVATYGVGALLAFVVYLMVVPQKFLTAPRPNTTDRTRIISYIGVTAAIIVLGTVTGRIDVVFMMIYGGAETTGFYSAAAQIAFLGALLASYMAVVFQPKVVQFYHDGTLMKYIRLNAYWAIGASLLCVPVALWLVPWLMPKLFGDEFVASITILKILLIGSCIDLFIMPILLPFSIQMLAREALIGEIIIACLFFIVFFAAPSGSGIRMAWLVTGVRLLKLFMYLGIVIRHLRQQNFSATSEITPI